MKGTDSSTTDADIPFPDGHLVSVCQVRIEPDGEVTVVARNAQFSELVGSLAQSTHMSYVLAQGTYPRVTLEVAKASPTDVIQALTFASGTQYRVVGGVFRFMPPSAATAPKDGAPAAGTDISLEFKGVKFAEAAAAVARAIHLSIVVQSQPQGQYADVNLTLQRDLLDDANARQDPLPVLKALCAAGHALFTLRDNVYYFEPQP